MNILTKRHPEKRRRSAVQDLLPQFEFQHAVGDSVSSSPRLMYGMTLFIYRETKFNSAFLETRNQEPLYKQLHQVIKEQFTFLGNVPMTFRFG